jgi:hypothetical protein
MFREQSVRILIARLDMRFFAILHLPFEMTRLYCCMLVGENESGEMVDCQQA